MTEPQNLAPAPLVWPVGALCRAIGEALDNRFNPVGVRGEITGFARAASGHCYFSLKDETGQMRCAMFRRAAGLLEFAPKDGDRVELRGRVAVYEPRGELQLVVESLRPAGQGALFEQFLRLKAKLEREGLFDAARKRALPTMPRAIGVVTSLGAAALHDVVTALQRRVQHIAVVIAPASVQGTSAPGELVQAIQRLNAWAPEPGAPALDLILLVRGGGSMEDLWAFNDEQLARTIAQSRLPVISGVGHETDFTIADFVADVRAPTPTAAAELVCQPTLAWLAEVQYQQERLRASVLRRLDQQAQRLDIASHRLGRPSGLAARQQLRLASWEQRLRHAVQTNLQARHVALERAHIDLPAATARALQRQGERLARADLRLGLLDPALVLKRGYAWLTDAQGAAVGRVDSTYPGQHLVATLADGKVDMTVTSSPSD
ncbi:MAG: exodeoxyribonuclease VII large subunit [Burkholderiales bacterium]